MQLHFPQTVSNFNIALFVQRDDNKTVVIYRTIFQNLQYHPVNFNNSKFTVCYIVDFAQVFTPTYSIQNVQYETWMKGITNHIPPQINSEIRLVIFLPLQNHWTNFVLAWLKMSFK